MTISVQVKRNQPGKLALLAELFCFVTFAQKNEFYKLERKRLIVFRDLCNIA